MLVAITICTKQRPVLLSAALASLVRLQTPKGVTIKVVVIENDTAEHSRKIVEEFASALDIYYFLETEPGLSPARNRCIKEALQLGADWIASTDDDAEVHSGWISAFVDASSRHPQTLAFMGRSRFLYPTRLPEWFPAPNSTPIATGTIASLYSTSNAFYCRDVFAADGLDMRFDMDFRFSGGEDTEFFTRLRLKHGPIMWVEEALVFEVVVAERNSVRWRFSRALRDGKNLGRIYVKHFGKVAGTFSSLHTAYRLVVFGLLKLLRGGATMLVNDQLGLKLAYQGLNDLVFTAGLLMSNFTTPPTPYRKIHGH